MSSSGFQLVDNDLVKESDEYIRKLLYYYYN